MAPRHECQNVEPEPEQEIDLLIDDVERENAEAVELLLPGGSANAVESAAERKVLG